MFFLAQVSKSLTGLELENQSYPFSVFEPVRFWLSLVLFEIWNLEPLS